MSCIASIVWVLLGAAACGDGDASDDDDTVGGDGDGDADTDGDGDGDADADADLVPVCEGEEAGYVSVSGYGNREDRVVGEHRMVVVASAPEELRLEEDLSCDPSGEIVLFFHFTGAPDEAWLPRTRASLLATLTDGWEGSYGVLRSPDGVLLWEGGDPRVDPAPTPRFRVVDVPEAEPCADRDPPCILRAPIRAAVQTDDGEVELGSGESRVVTVEGEPFLAGIASAVRTEIAEPGCVTDSGGGLYMSAYLVRTTPTDLPLVEPGPAPTDECPADAPAEGDPCTTRPNLQCDFDRGQGCIDGMECEGCFWTTRIRSQPEGVDCGIDPWDCMTNGNDGACSEEAVCTDCSCPDPIGDRFRCVQPGDDCPACE